MNDHIKALFEGQELSNEFKAKTEQIMEVMINEKEQAIREQLEAESRELFESQMSEKTEELESLTEQYVTEEVVPTVSKYLTAAVNEWLEENKIAVESGVKVELAESFLKGFVGLAEDHNLSVPESADNIVEKNEQEISKLKQRLDSLTEKNVELQESLDEQTKGIVFDRVCSDLTESQKEKLKGYCETVAFKDQSQFEDAIGQLKESYFPKADGEHIVESQGEQITESVTDEEDEAESSYLKALRSKAKW